MMKKWYCFAVLVVLCSVLLAGCGKQKKEEVPFSRNLEKGDLVYLSITEIEPVYGFSNSRTGALETLFCKTKAIDGSTVWVSISAGTFNKAFPQASNDMTSIMNQINIGNTKYVNSVSLEQPVVIHGDYSITTQQGNPEYDLPANEPFIYVQRVDSSTGSGS